MPYYDEMMDEWHSMDEDLGKMNDWFEGYYFDKENDDDEDDDEEPYQNPNFKPPIGWDDTDGDFSNWDSAGANA